jgi:hypothetical protein
LNWSYLSHTSLRLLVGLSQSAEAHLDQLVCATRTKSGRKSSELKDQGHLGRSAAQGGGANIVLDFFCD